MKKKLERLSLEKFQQVSISKFDASSAFGGHNTGGGTYDLGQNVTETYTSDTVHSNGGVSWETADLCIFEDGY